MRNRIPVACSLEGDEARRRSQTWHALAGQRIDVDRSDRRLSIRFVASDLLRAELHRLVVAERQCCGFVEWDLADLGDHLVLTVSGDQMGVAAMAESFGNPG